MPVLTNSNLRAAPMVMTPELAAKLIDRDYFKDVRASMRTADASASAVYGTDMANNDWMMNGEPIITDSEGRLLKGYRRLMACIDFNESFPTFLVEGVDPSAAETIGMHRQRRAADVLFILGGDYPFDVGATLALAAKIVDDRRTKRSTRLTGAQVERIAGECPEAVEAVRAVRASRLTSVVPVATLASVLFLATRSDPGKAEAFFTALDLAAQDLPSTLSAVTLVKALRSAREDYKDYNRRNKQLAFLIKAWNAHVADIALKRVVWSASEPLPTISNLQNVPNFKPKSLPASTTQRRSVEYAVVNTGITISFEEITPDEIDQILDQRNGPVLPGTMQNRRRSEALVDRIASDIAAGRWAQNGMTVKFSRTGRLLDGQHRLHGARKAGRSLFTMVVRGLPDEVFKTYDSATADTSSNKLAARGVKNAGVVVQMAKLLLRYEHKDFSAGIDPTHLEIVEFVTPRQEELAISAKLGKTFDFMSSQGVGAVHFLAAQNHKAKTDAFFASLKSGANLAENSPILVVRNWLRNDKKRGRVPDLIRLKALVSAWNGFYNGSSGKGLTSPKALSAGFADVAGYVRTAKPIDDDAIDEIADAAIGSDIAPDAAAAAVRDPVDVATDPVGAVAEQSPEVAAPRVEAKAAVRRRGYRRRSASSSAQPDLSGLNGDAPSPSPVDREPEADADEAPVMEMALGGETPEVAASPSRSEAGEDSARSASPDREPAPATGPLRSAPPSVRQALTRAGVSLGRGIFRSRIGR